jgi:uncharacterized protein YjbI with pentapeptide repeats
MTRCEFATDYINLENKIVHFQCCELPLLSSMCIFHDKEYHKNNAHVLTRSILRKLQLLSNHGLYLIGYKIPALEIRKINFTAPAYFAKSIVYGNMILEEIFFQEFDFSDSELHKTHISNVVFTREASFANTKFNNIATFELTEFHSTAIFRRAQFNEINFVSVSFQTEAIFDYANFQKKAFFGIKEIKGKADFFHVEFKDTVVFPKVKFLGETNFFYCIFYGKTDFILDIFNEETKFQNVLFKNGEETIFDVKDLSRVSFRGTDITKVRFTEKVVWGKNPKDRFKLIDDYHLEESVFPIFSCKSNDNKKEKLLTSRH